MICCSMYISKAKCLKSEILKKKKKGIILPKHREKCLWSILLL